MLANLIDNAARYGGGTRVRAWREENEILIAVEDDGRSFCRLACLGLDGSSDFAHLSALPTVCLPREARHQLSRRCGREAAEFGGLLRPIPAGCNPIGARSPRPF